MIPMILNYDPQSEDGSNADDDVYDIFAGAVSSTSIARRWEEEFGIVLPVINSNILNFQKDSPVPLTFDDFNRKIDALYEEGFDVLSLLQERLHLS